MRSTTWIEVHPQSQTQLHCRKRRRKKNIYHIYLKDDLNAVIATILTRTWLLAPGTQTDGVSKDPLSDEWKRYFWRRFFCWLLGHTVNAGTDGRG